MPPVHINLDGTCSIEPDPFVEWVVSNRKAMVQSGQIPSPGNQALYDAIEELRRVGRADFAMAIILLQFGFDSLLPQEQGAILATLAARPAAAPHIQRFVQLHARPIVSGPSPRNAH